MKQWKLTLLAIGVMMVVAWQPAQARKAHGVSPDRKFMKEAAIGGMAEVELGRLAANRGASSEVRNFGQRMVTDHSQANSDLMRIAANLRVKLPTDLDQKHKNVLNRLSRLSGSAFDRAYVKDMVKDHKKDLKAFRKEANSGQNADVRAFAAKYVPVIAHHLQMIQEIDAGMNGNMHTMHHH